MRNVSKRFGLAATLLMGLFAAPSNAGIIVGLTDANSLVTFDDATPGTLTSQVGIVGTTGTIVAIDRRPNNGALYGLDTNNRLYTINVSTGVATFASTLATAPTSQFVGFDFNPVPDRLRITDVNRNNLRVNVATGATTVDGMLTYALTDINVGAIPQIVGSAYTNNFLPSPRTTPGTSLYGIDTALDNLVLQNPPNNGTLNTVGSLGINVGNLVGFDISGVDGTAFLSSNDGAITNFYTVNLSSGAASLVGSVGGGVLLLDIAAPIGVPEPATFATLSIGAVIGLLAYKRSRR